MKRIVTLIILICSYFILSSQVQLDVQGNATSVDTVAKIRVNYTGQSDVVGLKVVATPDGPSSVWGIGGLFIGGSYGVWAESLKGIGVYGISVDSVAVYGYSQNGYGVKGESENQSGIFGKSIAGFAGVVGLADSTDAFGVYGGSLKGTGVMGYSQNGDGVKGESENQSGIFGKSIAGFAGVVGLADSTDAFGVYGGSLKGTGVMGYSQNGDGVKGESENQSGIFGKSIAGFAGVVGLADSTDAFGVYGGSLKGTGVMGYSQNGDGVKGESENQSGIFGKSIAGFAGVVGLADSTDAFGVYGGSLKGTGVMGYSQNGDGVKGESENQSGIFGKSIAGFAGVVGLADSTDAFGVYGGSLKGTGVMGYSQNGDGVKGESENQSGIFGKSIAGFAGVVGLADSTDAFGVYGGSLKGTGVMGYSQNGDGIKGESENQSGIFGKSIAGFAGVVGLADSTDAIGVYGASLKGIGVHGTSVDSFGMHGHSVNMYGVFGDSDNAFDFVADVTDGSTPYGQFSSIRWKSNIRNISSPLTKLSKLRGVYYNWNEEFGGHHAIGFIAEEVGEVLPEIVVYEENGVDAVGLDYSMLTPLLVEAANAMRQEYQDMYDHQESRIKSLESEVHELKHLLKTLVSINKSSE